MYYEMYKIHRQSQQMDAPLKSSKKTSSSSAHQNAEKKNSDASKKAKSVRFDSDKKQKSQLEDDDDDGCLKPKVKIATITIDADQDEQTQRKKRTQEDMVADFVKILEQMMNPRQAVTSLMAAAMGVAAITVSAIYIGNLPQTAVNSKQLVVVLIAYGVLQVILATAFFITCMQTTIAVSKGVKDAFQIVVGLLVALIYVTVTLISLAVGIFGFYKTLCIVSFVEYDDIQSTFYCPPLLFYTSLVVFILHIVLIVAKCCCCK